MSNNGSASINFKVSDNGVGSFMDNIKRKSDAMANDMIRNAQAQSKSAKEQTQIIQEQIKLIERKTQIEKLGALEEAKRARESRLTRLDEYKYNQIKDVQSQQRNKTITNQEARTKVEQIQSRVGEAKDRVEQNYTDKTGNIAKQYRESVVTNQVLRQGFDNAKTQTREQLNELRKGNSSIVGAVAASALPMAMLVHQSATQKFEEEKEKDKEKKEKKEGGEGGSGGGWLSFAKALAFDRSLSLASNIPNAKNELDFIRPLTSMAGVAAGGVTGNLMDAMNIKIAGTGAGNTNWGAMGTEIGEKAGEFFGAAMERSYRGRDELTNSSFKLQALLGNNIGVNGFGNVNPNGTRLGGTGKSGMTGDLSAYGVDYLGQTDIEYQIAQRQGTGRGLRRGSENVVAAERGIGVARETSYAVMELQRSSKEENRDFLKTMGGILQAGKGNIFKGDNSFLNEFISRNFITLQRELLKTQSTVATGTTMDVLQRFKAIGGPFAAKDSRSLGLISQIQGSLANPNSDNMKALSMSIMRTNNPGMGIAGLLEEQQKGFGSPTYLKSMLGAVNGMGGGKDMQIMNIAGMFGLQGNMNAARLIYENQDKLTNGSISMNELMGKGAYGEGAIRSRAQEQTSVYSKSTAEIQNKFVDDITGAIGFVGDKMKDLFGDMLDSVKDYVNDRMKIGGSPELKINKTYTPTGAYRSTNNKGQATITVDGIQSPAIPAALLKKNH